ncbi:MAG: HAD family phosphatase [Microthrixaceae bacterium]|nr:HAD family phosphatase [Microthrixaceae bacterium]
MACHETTVVWDLGNVLIPWDRTLALAAAVGDPVEARHLSATVFTMELNALVDAASDRRALLDEIERVSPGSSWIVEAYLDHFEVSLGAVIESSAALVEELTDNDIRCVGLSNFSALTYRDVAKRYPVLARLDGVLISGEVGITKPDPRIYRLCEQRFGLDPERLVFIDDSPANVEAASALGWDAVLFTDPSLLREQLLERSLPLAAGENGRRGH